MNRPFLLLALFLSFNVSDASHTLKEEKETSPCHNIRCLEPHALLKALEEKIERIEEAKAQKNPYLYRLDKMDYPLYWDLEKALVLSDSDVKLPYDYPFAQAAMKFLLDTTWTDFINVAYLQTIKHIRFSKN